MNSATNAALIQVVNTASAASIRGSVSVKPIGAEYSAIKVNRAVLGFEKCQQNGQSSNETNNQQDVTGIGQ